MKKTIPVIICLVLLSACNSSDNSRPYPEVPTISSNPSEAVSELPRPTPVSPTKAPEPEITKTVEPKPTAEAVPPAIEFAQRWGKKYPAVPEYLILKTANYVCDAIKIKGERWENDSVTMLSIVEYISEAGMKESDALEFAQDAHQNYCSSRI